MTTDALMAMHPWPSGTSWSVGTGRLSVVIRDIVPEAERPDVGGSVSFDEQGGLTPERVDRLYTTMMQVIDEMRHGAAA
jgi:hypothetical protein